MNTVCLFNSQTAWGGAEKWHHEIAIRLQEQGYPVLVITNRNSPLFQRVQQTSLPVCPMRISNLSVLNPWKVLTISRIFRRHQVSTLFVNLPADLKVAGIAAKLAGVPQIIYRRGIGLPVKNRWLNRLLFQHVLTDVLTNSQATRQLLLQESSSLIAEEKIAVIQNGIDLPTFDQLPSRPIYSRTQDALILGNAGRLSPEKGQHDLIDLVKRLQERGIRCQVLIAGTGKLAIPLKQDAREAGVEQNVRFLGFVENIKALLESIDMFVLPSRYEGASNALIEAMAAGKPVVAFHVSSNPEIVVDGETGFLVEQGDLSALAHRVEALARDEALRATLGRNARKRVEEHFTMQRVVRELVALIEGTTYGNPTTTFRHTHRV
ncbi:glycosyltransferase [candidate division KSB3 bacterium]|uniref:Glycosyltransferase n=1 Tax=candidate division KSB3 bacterium TaxID=2044937 RepID=A0A9D5JU87_9BACT|nr:glycosyltransferase [candidate division KSB3 bacterium]MBD3324347.1 glycosyltransferase [candidate division KSB3 bacterium]